MHPDDHTIAQASAILQRGELVAFPTETVYGLGANALSDSAVAQIYAVKGRPQFNPLIVHVAAIEDAKHYVEFTAAALTLATYYWPGPLTLVLNRKKNCALSLLVSAGMDTVAIRVPAHPVAQALLKACKLPVAAPSANRSGRISPTEAAHVHEELGGKLELIIDGGPCPLGIESTVVDATGDIPAILRPGSVSTAQIFSVLQSLPVLNKSAPARDYKSPGMLASHYAPEASVRLNATDVSSDEALLAFGAPIPGAAVTENLSPAGDLCEAASNLFRMLRKLDSSGAKNIAVMPIPEDGKENALGIAINDRLARAASPRHETS